jgi:hypothetical protein
VPGPQSINSSGLLLRSSTAAEAPTDKLPPLPEPVKYNEYVAEGVVMSSHQVYVSSKSIVCQCH